MPSQKKHRMGRLGEQSSSFNGQDAATMAQLRRPQTLPDLVSYHKLAIIAPSPEVLPRQPPKLLFNVTMLGSLGPVQVIMTQESTVGDLVSAAVRQYLKESRRPILPTTDPSEYDLHYSQFSLECESHGLSLSLNKSHGICHLCFDK